MSCEEESILKLMELGTEYTAKEIYILCSDNHLDISSSSLARKLRRFEKHSPWEGLGIVKKRLEVSRKGGVCFMWIRIIK